MALGRFPADCVAPLDFVESATVPALLAEIGKGIGKSTADLVILDGEATPYGGIGVAKQLRDELLHRLPIVVITGRREDAWLARWSRADAVLSHPIDPIELTNAVVPILRSRIAG